jgi:hypothetical protein
MTAAVRVAVSSVLHHGPDDAKAKAKAKTKTRTIRMYTDKKESKKKEKEKEKKALRPQQIAKLHAMHATIRIAKS